MARTKSRRRVCAVLSLAGLGLAFLATAAGSLVSPEDEQAVVAEWRAGRVQALTSPTGWLALEGLFWLKPGANSFGSGQSQQLRLDSPKLAAQAGVFELNDGKVRFTASKGRTVTIGNKPVTSVEMATDATAAPTILQSGTLEFFVIARGGQYGVRVRDRDSLRRREFRGISYFPVEDSWVLNARFEPYDPVHVIPIVNILGMEVPMTSPGALVFERDGREWRLDAVLEEPQAEELFIMFADATSGRTTYGGGRFLKAPLPKDGHVRLDFNLAYNPPCAFNNFATCPLPPPQNRVSLAVTAGEMKYGDGVH